MNVSVLNKPCSTNGSKFCHRLGRTSADQPTVPKKMPKTTTFSDDDCSLLRLYYHNVLLISIITPSDLYSYNLNTRIDYAAPPPPHSHCHRHGPVWYPHIYSDQSVAVTYGSLIKLTNPASNLMYAKRHLVFTPTMSFSAVEEFFQSLATLSTTSAPSGKSVSSTKSTSIPTQTQSDVEISSPFQAPLWATSSD